jgi:hypothetical protein
LKFAARPPDETHPYGHGKAEPIAAVVVAFGVLAAALGLAIESIREIRTPHHGPAPFTLGILIVVIVVKEILFRYVNRVGATLKAPRSKPTPGIIAAMRSLQWQHSSGSLPRSSAAEAGKARMTGRRFSPAALLRPMASDYCAQLCTKSWIQPRVEKLSDRVRNAAAAVPGVIEIEKSFVGRWA